jgi:hypothetical protein
MAYVMNSWHISDLPERIARKIVIDPVTGCWLWQGARNGPNRTRRIGGYGVIKWQRKMEMVHRVVYELLVDPIPDGLTLDHVKARGCQYRHCCWPAHLEPVTREVNSLRGDTPWTRNLAKTHCKHGHEFTEENTYHPPGGGRHCRTCNREAMRRYSGYTGLGSPWTQNKAKTHCLRGHEFTPENTYVTKKGQRYCRACARIRAKGATL